MYVPSQFFELSPFFLVVSDVKESTETDKTPKSSIKFRMKIPALFDHGCRAILEPVLYLGR
jgi:hypothetical protein